MPASILVIDDNRTNLDLMVYLLRAFGHTPSGANDGIAGLEAARADHYDLVLADILMPGIDGYELARRFKADPKLADRKIVAVTALAMVGDRERALAAGFDGYIAKPIDPQTFVTQVDEYLPARLRSTGPVYHPSPPQPVRRETPSGPIVLAVDDVRVNVHVIGGALRPFGYRVIEAHSAREAYEKAQETRPDLILCDVHMPEGNGFDLIAQVKADPQLCSVPFVFMSSTAWRTSEKLRGMELGAASFLLRPIDPVRLVEEIERWIDGDTRAQDSGR